MVEPKLFVGDLHGEFEVFEEFVRKQALEFLTSPITVLGDMGFGFPQNSDGHAPFKSPLPIYFIRGNHDDYSYILEHHRAWQKDNWFFLDDGTVKDGVLYLGGGLSIDKDRRIIGVSYWDNEEISYRRMGEILDSVRHNPIHTVVSHDCPSVFYQQLYPHKERKQSRTTTFLTEVLGIVRPHLWLCGHHHIQRRYQFENTTLRILDTLIDNGILWAEF